MLYLMIVPDTHVLQTMNLNTLCEKYFEEYSFWQSVLNCTPTSDETNHFQFGQTRILFRSLDWNEHRTQE